jgi:hypothetical protein
MYIGNIFLLLCRQEEAETLARGFTNELKRRG